MRVDPLAALERGQLLRHVASRSARPATSSASTGFCSTRARASASSSRARSSWRSASRDLDLEPLAGPRLLGDRAERVQRGGLLLDLEGRGVAQVREPVAAARRRRGPSSRARRRSISRDVGLLGGEPLLGLGGDVRPPSASRSVASSACVGLELLLDVRPAPQPAVDLDVAQVLLLRRSPRRRQPARERRTRRRRATMSRADDRQHRTELQDPERVEHDAGDADQRRPRRPDRGSRENGRQRRARLDASKSTSTSPSSICSQRRDRRSRATRSRSTAGRRTASGCGDGWLASSALSSSRTSTAVAVPLVALRGRVALGGQALGLARLLEHARGARSSGLLGRRAGARGPATACRGRARGAPARPRRPASLRGRVRDRLLGDLEPARVLGAARAQALERAVELLAGAAGPAVRAADRRLEPVAERGLVALRGRPARGGGPTPSTGRTPRSARRTARPARSSARAGSVMTSPSSSSRTVPSGRR